MDNKPSSMCTRLKTKKIVCISLFVFILSCNKKQLYYHGVVIDENKNPLSNVTVKELDGFQSTISIKNGYFKLYRNPNVISSLIFSKKGYEIRKVKTVWSQSGETVEYTFLNKKPDTITLNLKK